MEEVLKKAAEFSSKFLEKYPDKTEELEELLDLLEMEIAEGGSPDNELELFLSSLDELEFEIHYGED